MYRVACPPADLAPFVRFFWGAIAPATTADRHTRIVPDGCCELIVHFGDPFAQDDDVHGRRIQPRGFIFGQLQRSLLLAPCGATGIVGVRFRPAGVSGLFGIDARALGGLAIPLAELFGRTGEDTVERIVAARDIDPGFMFVTDLLRSCARSRGASASVRSTAHAASLLARPGASLRQVARELAQSPRSIQRGFAASVGLTPRDFIRMTRIDAAARLLRGGPVRLADAAQSTGFADQAHFSREFRALVGVTPLAYLRELGQEHAVVP
jgi:AraC-like DNA-binding protein